MLQKTLLRIDRLPDNLLSALQTRDVALWLRGIPRDVLAPRELVAFLGLPWRVIISETYDQKVIDALQAAATFSDPMTRKRGFVQVIDNDPSRIALPERCLPLYLLNGRESSPDSASFENRLRRLTMLESLRRLAPRDILVISTNDEPIPDGLTELWSSGFRSYLTFVSATPDADQLISSWVQRSEGITVASVLLASAASVITDIVERYQATYPEERRVIRIRDVEGSLHKIDISEVDEPERPVLESYAVIEERDLTPLAPTELPESEFVNFFTDATSSWRSYAAGVPWLRDSESKERLTACLKRLDTAGSEENCVAYIVSESGAGGTTLARTLAWQCARMGYPVLVARPVPFEPDALPVANFLTRVHNALHTTAGQRAAPAAEHPSREGPTRRYEAPWVIVFDTLHWQSRDSELLRFRNELEKSGRPVCIIVVAGPSLPLSFFTGVRFRKLAELNHAIDLDDARQLGVHLNQFLKNYGKQREKAQWEQFYREHTVRYLEGIAAFWVALSFWIQGHYDLSESIQEWMYRSFKQNAVERPIKDAVLRIAALSSERLPLPESLLPTSKTSWPISQLLADARQSLAALGLVRISSDGEKYWALVHDILGRFLINALFYDFPQREELGFREAKDPEHLRFMLLQKISQEPLLGERAYRSIGEDFATTIFKIDPDHGHSNFVPIWREILAALDAMPRALRDTSRLFRHHCAVSRRRIAKLDERFYGVSADERLLLLQQAIDDIKYALDFIESTPGAESNLNLLNSLANAYIDLADAEAIKGASQERLAELRRLANDATRRAYAESPTNSFVIETYVKNLLQSARSDREHAVEQSIEALGILFSVVSSNEAEYRASQLGSLADQALNILLRHTSPMKENIEPKNALDVLVQAWRALAEGGQAPGLGLSEVPLSSREFALERLGHPAGRGNLQVIRLTYDLVCANRPLEFNRQLELLEQLIATNIRIASQLRLEYAILLFQNGRALEGEKVFRDLRRLWRESEQFVHIPERLRWLRDADAKTLRTINAFIGSDTGTRPVGRVQEFGTAMVPFRPEEFGFRDFTAGMRFVCHVSFGHNGPFLRPVTVGPQDVPQVLRA
jgi:hypothetical protein